MNDQVADKIAQELNGIFKELVRINVNLEHLNRIVEKK